MHRKTNRLFLAVLAFALVVAVGVVGCGKQAEQSQDSQGDQAEQTEKAEPFASWSEYAPAVKVVKDYVEDVCDESSDNYIPPEERIVVSDFDGTLFGELNPIYFDWALSVHRVLYDSTYQATDEQIAIAKEIEETERTGEFQKDGMAKQARMAAEAYGGMTPDELWDYSDAFASQPSPKFKNMLRGEAYYAPMLELAEYLIDHDFKFYVITGTDRTVARQLVDGIIDIPPSQVIGSDNSMVASEQGDTDGLEYTWDGKGDDKLVFGGKFGIKDLNMNKVTAIAREIGVQPVIALGNSSSDYAMLSYVTNDNPHKSLSLFVLADDTEREWGNPEKAEKYRKECEEQNFLPISTKNDWKTIYGGDVEKDESWQWNHPDATGPNTKDVPAEEGEQQPEAEQKDAA